MRIKTCLHLVWVAAGLASPARSDVVIYRVIETGTYVGQGSRLPVRVLGYTVMDLDALNSRNIGKFTLNRQKYYSVGDGEGAESRVYTIVERVTSRAFVTSTFYTVHRTETENGESRESWEFGQGRDTWLETAPGQTVWMPRSFRITAHAILEGNGTIHGETRLRSLFDAKRTQAANARGATVDQLIDELEAQFASEGYVLWE